MTGVENSTRAHSFPTSPPPPAKLVCNVNIVHRAALMLYCTTVLYSTQHMQKGRGALSSCIVLHSCLPDAYKQRNNYKLHIKELFP